MPARSIAPLITAWRGGHRNLPGPFGGGSPPGGVPFLDQMVAGYSFGARIYPGADITAGPTTWTPVDISAHILQPGDGSIPAITIQRGRLGEQQETSPASCTFTLRNDAAKGNGDYSPRRATGRYYPYMRAGLPVDAFIATSSATFVRFAGKVESLEPGWDETGSYAFVVVTAYGVLYDIQQGSTPLNSAMYRTFTADTTNQIGYWSLEDGINATSAASLVAGVAPLQVRSGTVEFGIPGPAGAAAGVDFTGGGLLAGAVPGATSGSIELTMAVRLTNIGVISQQVQFRTTTGLIFRARYVGTSPAFIEMEVFSSDIVGGFDTFPFQVDNPDTDWHLWQYTLVQNGANIEGQLFYDGVSLGTFTGGSGFAGLTLGKITDVVLGLMADPVTYAPDYQLSQVELRSPVTLTPTDVASRYAAFTGHSGETPSDRLTRISAEEGIPFALPAGGSDPARTMGPQSVTTLAQIAREAEAAEGGVLEDGVGFGWQLWTVESRYNQTATFTPALTQLAPPLLPVENTLRVRNDVTASRPSGSSARYTQPSGQPYAATGPGGLGGRSFPATVNVDDDDQLLNYAAWMVHLGTVDADRYAPIAVNLAARTALIPAWLAVGNGDRWTTPTTYPTGGTAPDVLVEGWTEGLGRMVYAVAANTAPADPWNVAVVDDPTYAVVDSDSSTLAGALAAGANGAVSVNVGGILWSVAAGDYPLDFNVAGERVTGTMSGAADPQTLTISVRAVNGVSKDLPAGAAVSLWLPVVVGV